MTVKLGTVSGVLQHAKGLLAALRVGRLGQPIHVNEETIDIVKRDQMRLRDLQYHASQLEDFVSELEASTINTKKSE